MTHGPECRCLGCLALMREAEGCWQGNLLAMPKVDRIRLQPFIMYLRALRVAERPTSLGAGSLECGRGLVEDADADGWGSNARGFLED